MKTRSYPQLAGLAASLLVAASLTPQGLASDLSIARNRIYSGARFGFNISADIRNHVVPPLIRPQYDDGFVFQDISGGQGGQTWYWGYSTASQMQIAGGNRDLELSIATSPRDQRIDSFSGDPQAGFEIVYGRELGRFELLEDREWVWGLEFGFGSQDVNINETDAKVGNVNRVTDFYRATALVVPPSAPYAGRFNGPGPLIALNPANSVNRVVPIQSTLTAKLDGLVYGFKLGPFLEAPIFQRLSIGIGGGLAAVNTDFDFTYSETLTFTDATTRGLSPAARAGQTSAGKWLVGYYGTGRIILDLTDAVSVYLAGQYQSFGDELTINGPHKSATLKLDRTYEAVVGFRFSF